MRDRRPDPNALLAEAAIDHTLCKWMVGEPPTLVRATLQSIAGARLTFALGSDSREDTPAEGHVLVVSLLCRGWLVAFHTRVKNCRPRMQSVVVETDYPNDILVYQARRAFRIPVKGLGLQAACTKLPEIELQDLSLLGFGVRTYVSDPPRTLLLELSFESLEVSAPARLVASHPGGVVGYQFELEGDSTKRALRTLVMAVERAWVARERRVG